MVNFNAQFQYQLDQKNLYNLYMRYGEDYKSPCIRFAVDTMNDQASKFSASMFFKNFTQVTSAMQEELGKTFDSNCYSMIQSLQITQVSLPAKFEDALTATNVAIQQSITVKQQQNNAIIDMNTQVSQARIAAPVVINNAEA